MSIYSAIMQCIFEEFQKGEKEHKLLNLSIASVGIVPGATDLNRIMFNRTMFWKREKRTHNVQVSVVLENYDSVRVRIEFSGIVHRHFLSFDINDGNFTEKLVNEILGWMDAIWGTSQGLPQPK